MANGVDEDPILDADEISREGESEKKEHDKDKDKDKKEHDPSKPQEPKR